MIATFAVERCDACGAVQDWPRHACTTCGATDFSIFAASGTATIYALTTIHRPPASGDTGGPYAVALLALDQGGRVMARAPRGVAIGDRVIASRTDPRAIPDVVVSR